MANPSLSEYLAQSQRGLYQSVFGPEYLHKEGLGAGTVFQSGNSDIFQTTYGRKVWQALNNQTRFFNAIPRVVWGNTAGWRVRSDRGSGRSRPVTEVGSLPTVDVSAIQTISSLPRIVSTTFGASVKSVFTAQLEGGVGDVLALENENAQLDHIKEINEELNAGSAYIVNDGVESATQCRVPAAVAKHFKIGDAVSRNDGGTMDVTSGSVISAANTTNGNLTMATVTAEGNWADGDIVQIFSRAGFTSIQDVVAEDGMGVGGATNGANVKAYDIDLASRTAGGWNAGASVQYNSGVGRDLTLTHLDTAIQKIRENGGEPKLILLGHDQYFKLERLLNSQQRYMGQEEYQVGIGSEKTYPGTRTGLVLSTYMGIPILPDADVAKSVSSADAVLGTDVFVLDTDYIEMAIAQPTQYVENRDYFAANALVVRGLLYTMGEMRVKNIWTQAKISDLNS